MAAIITFPTSDPAPHRRARPERPVLHVVPGATYRRRRVAAVALLLVALGVSVHVMAPGRPAAAPPRLELDGSTYVAQPGDTLWRVAAGLDAGGDIRDVVARLADVNGGEVLYPGQVVEIPPELMATAQRSRR